MHVIHISKAKAVESSAHLGIYVIQHAAAVGNRRLPPADRWPDAAKQNVTWHLPKVRGFIVHGNARFPRIFSRGKHIARHPCAWRVAANVLPELRTKNPSDTLEQLRARYLKSAKQYRAVEVQ